MSRWHREHPELVGTDADPWMDSPGYANAVREQEEREIVSDLRAKYGNKRLWFVYDEDDPERGYFGEESEEYETGERREGAEYVLMSVGVEGEPRDEARFGNDLRAAVDAMNERKVK